jgi:hypothetical protein
MFSLLIDLLFCFILVFDLANILQLSYNLTQKQSELVLSLLLPSVTVMVKTIFHNNNTEIKPMIIVEHHILHFLSQQFKFSTSFYSI